MWEHILLIDSGGKAYKSRVGYLLNINTGIADTDTYKSTSC